MSNVVRLPQLAWYETRELELPLPDNWQVEVCNMAGYNRPALEPDEIRAAIRSNLVGIPPLRELARGKNEVVIIFDDMTRVTRAARIVPYVLEELAEAGIPDDKIRFIVALGCHGALDRLDFVKKLGEETLARFPVFNHNAFGNCTYVGTTSYGTKVCVNAEVMKCDLKIGIGSVVPHLMSGFGGGGKIILPGVTSIETTEADHMDRPRNKMGMIDDNAMSLNIEEAATLAGLDVKIDCIVNMWGETVAIFAGALIPAYAAAVQEARTHYLTPETGGKDIVIVNNFTKASESWLSLAIAYPAVRSEGGDVVLVANAPEGLVTHYLLGPFGKTIGGNLRAPVKAPSHVNHLIIYTEYPDIAGQGWVEPSDKILFMSNWDDVLGVLRLHGDAAKVAVYPNAEIQYCV